MGARSSRWLLYIAITAALLTLIVAGHRTYRSVERELTEAALERRLSIARLAAEALNGRLDRAIDVGVSLATRVRFRELVSAGNWAEAGAILHDVPVDFPYVDRLFLADLKGTLMVDVPELPGVRGANFAHREWFQGFTRDAAPYVTAVYRRAAEPQRSVFAVSVPVRGAGGVPVGILVIQVDLDGFFAWTSAVDFGHGGSLYVVDRAQQLAWPRRGGAAEAAPLLRGNPTVDLIARGGSGVDVGPGPLGGEPVVAAYVPARHGWSVIAMQPAVEAFAARDRQLDRVLAGFGLFAGLCIALLYPSAQLLLRRREADEGRRIRADLERSVAERTRALESASRELADFYDNAPCGYHSVDAEGRFVRINGTWLKWLGYRHDEVVGRLRHPDIMTPESAQLFREKWFPQFLRDGVLEGVEFTYVRRDGSTFSASLNASVVRDAGGGFVMSRSTVFDISERKRVEREMEALNARLSALNRELEGFSYSVSHDLRAPLRAVDGYAQMLQEDCGEQLGKEGARLVGVVRAEAARMGELIDDLLAFARTGQQPLQVVEVDMAGLVRAVLAELTPVHGSAEIVLGDLPPVPGDRALLERVWANLIGNALKYSARRERPRIEIGGRIADGERGYWVRDNGAGFDMRYAGNLFGVFRRLHRADEFEGTGVGLALVHRIVTRHGGRVRGEGEVDAGACFEFTLPVGIAA